MADVLRMQLDIQNNLEKELAKSSKGMKSFNSLIEEASSKFERIETTLKKGVSNSVSNIKSKMDKLHIDDKSFNIEGLYNDPEISEFQDRSFNITGRYTEPEITEFQDKSFNITGRYTEPEITEFQDRSFNIAGRYNEPEISEFQDRSFNITGRYTEPEIAEFQDRSFNITGRYDAPEIAEFQDRNFNITGRYNEPEIAEFQDRSFVVQGLYNEPEITEFQDRSFAVQGLYSEPEISEFQDRSFNITGRYIKPEIGDIEDLETKVSLDEASLSNIKNRISELTGNINEVKFRAIENPTSWDKMQNRADEMSSTTNEVAFRAEPENFEGLKLEFDKTREKVSEVNKGIGKMGEGVKAVTGFVGTGLANAFSSVGRVIDTIVPGFLALFSVATIVDAASAVFEMDTAMTQLSYRMGHGADGANDLKNAVYETNEAIGIGVDKSSELVSSLSQMRLPISMMQDMTTSVGTFAELTGASAEEAAKLGAELVVVGGLGQESADNIMASMVNVQRAVGLTSGEVNQLTSAITSSTQMLNTMGKSAGEIESYNKGITQLAGAFASVGVEVDQAISLMDELLDPGKVQDHAFLLSQLGVSLGDAFSGNIDPAQLATGFRDLGQNLQNMTGPAAASMAEQLGMSVRDLRQLGELGDKELNAVSSAMSEGASASEAMQQALSDSDTPAQALNRAYERVKGEIGIIVNSFLPLLEKGITWLADNTQRISAGFQNLAGWVRENAGILQEKFSGVMKTIGGFPKILLAAIPVLIGGIVMLVKFMKKRFNTTATDFSSSLTKGVSEGIKQGAKKGREKLFKELSGSNVDLNVRTQKGPGYQQMMADAEEWSETAKGNLLGPIRRLAEGTASWKRKLAETSKPVSALSEATASMSETAKKKYEIAKNEAAIQREINSSKLSELETELSQLSGRKQYLELQREQRDLTSREERELTKVQKAIERNGKITRKNQNEKEQFIEQGTKAELRALRSIGNQQLQSLTMEKQARLDNLQSTRDSLFAEQQKAEANKGVTDALITQLSKKEASGKLTSAEAVKLDQLKGISAKQQESVSKITTELSKQNSELDKAKNEYVAINQVANERKIDIGPNAQELANTRGVFQNLSDYLVTKGREFKGLLGETGEKLANSARVGANAIKERLNPKNIGASLRGGLKGIGKNVVGMFKRGGKAAAGEIESASASSGGGRRGGGLMKLAGPIAIIGGLLSRTEKGRELLTNTMQAIQEPLNILIGALSSFIQPILDTLVPILTNLMNDLMPAINAVLGAVMSVFNQVVDTLKPIFDKIIDTLMPVINKIAGVIITVIGEVMNFLGPMIEQVMNVLMPVIDALLATIMPILDGIIAVVMPILDGIMESLGPVFDSIMSTLTPLFETLTETLGPIIETLKNALMPIFDLLMQLREALFSIFVDTLIPVFTQIFDALIPVVEQVISSIGPVLDMLSSVLATLIGSIMSIVEVLISAIGPVLNLVGTVIGTLVDVLSSVIGLVMALLPPVISIIEMLINVLVPVINIIMTLVSALVDVIMPIVGILVDVLGSVISIIADALIGALNFLMPIIQFLTGAITWAFDLFQAVMIPVINILQGSIKVYLGLLIGAMGGLIEAVGGLLVSMIEMPAKIAAAIAHPFNERRREAKREELLAATRETAVYRIADNIRGAGESMGETAREMRQDGMNTVGEAVRGAFNKDDIETAVAEGSASGTETGFRQPELQTEFQSSVTEGTAQGTADGQARIEFTPAQLRAGMNRIDIEQDLGAQTSGGTTSRVEADPETQTAAHTEELTRETREAREEERNFRQAEMGRREAMHEEMMTVLTQLKRALG